MDRLLATYTENGCVKCCRNLLLSFSSLINSGLQKHVSEKRHWFFWSLFSNLIRVPTIFKMKLLFSERCCDNFRLFLKLTWTFAYFGIEFFVSRLHLTYMHTLYQNIYTSHDTDVTICRIAYFRSKHEIYINKTNSCRQADIKRTDAKNESLLTLFFFFYYDRFIGVIENFRFLFLFSLLMAALFLIQLFAIELCCLHNALVWNGKY